MATGAGVPSAWGQVRLEKGQGPQLQQVGTLGPAQLPGLPLSATCLFHQGLAAGADADREEAALRRKLEDLTRNISDQGTSSEEEQAREEEARLDVATPSRALPRLGPEVRPPPAVSAGHSRGRSTVGSASWPEVCD